MLLVLLTLLRQVMYRFSSWKLLTTSFVVNFQMSEQMIDVSVELFVKFDQESATTFRFPSVNKKP
jgi:hypothetical protein